MNNQNGLAPHEMIELRELMDSCLTGAKKIHCSLSMVEDKELKSYMEKCLNSKKTNLESMETFVENTLNIR